MKTELLAPAKNISIAKTAIDCGADAVYVGAYAYGARKNASNSLDDIEKIINYAHKFYAKVYVTVNTIISDEELHDVKILIQKLYDIGSDALIIQDAAIIKMSIENKIPPIPLHISTQCDNRIIEKIKFYQNTGLTRVVLARELSSDKIKEIVENNPQIEFETFIHGALCTSYSGQCYMSCYIGGRSANKGECAQPCRKKYSLIDDKGSVIIKNKYLLSLKDFNASAYIEKLIDAGVKSFKIEGRLKDEFYVKNVTGFYRKLLDKYSDKTASGKITLGFNPDLNKSFNRGYTDCFLEKRNNCFNFDTPKFMGEKIGTVVKIKKDNFTVKLLDGIKLNPQDGLCFDNENGCLINKIIGNVVYPNNMPKISLNAVIYRNIDAEFEKSVLNAKTSRKIGVDISYSNYKLKAADEDNNTLTVEIKEREAAKNPEKMCKIFKKSILKTGGTNFYIRKFSLNDNVPFILVSAINEYRRKLLDELSALRAQNYKHKRQKTLKYAEFHKTELDYRANVHNLEAKKFYENCGAKIVEMSVETGIPSRQIELMRTKHCIKYALNICKSNKNLFLTDEKNAVYPLKFDCTNCEMTVLSPQ